MPSENDFGDVMPRRVMTLFLVVDCSGSMQIHGNIGKVNSAIEEMVPMLKEVSQQNSDAEIKIAVLSFSSGAQWQTNGAQSLDSFQWHDMAAYGQTSMGAAFSELESKLSRSAFLQSATGSYAPAIMLLTDGHPTDDWQSGLNQLKKNNWFRMATKIAIGLGEGADPTGMAILNSFTDNPDAVLPINGSGDRLKGLLCRLAVVTSTLQSRSSSVGDTDTDENLARERGAEAVRETMAEGQSTGFETGNSFAGTDTEAGQTSSNNPWDDVDAW